MRIPRIPWSKVSAPGPRASLVAASAIAFACAALVWVLSTHTEHTETKTTVTSEQRLPRDGRAPAGLVTVGRRTIVVSGTKDADAGGEQPLILGLLTLAGGLVLVAIFYPRIEAFTLGAISVTLRPFIREAAAEVGEKAQDPQVAAEASAGMMLDILEQSSKGGVSEADVQHAKERAIEKLSGIEDAVLVTPTSAGPEISLDRAEEQPRVTTREQLLPEGAFERNLVEQINAVPEVRLGRRLYAIDAQSEEVLAALGFNLVELPGHPLRVVVEAHATHDGAARHELAESFVTALIASLHAIAAKLDGERRVFFRFAEEPTGDRLRSLLDLGLKPATPAETRGMEPGVYWISEP